jgi:S-formylglutathione hydrolase FrmB
MLWYFKKKLKGGGAVMMKKVVAAALAFGMFFTSAVSFAGSLNTSKKSVIINRLNDLAKKAFRPGDQRVF